jgi:hypothetical protein
MKTTSKAVRKHDPAENRLDQINRALKCSVQLRRDGLWIEFTGRMIHLVVPPHLQQAVWDTLAGRGATTAALAKRLRLYGIGEFERRFGSVYPEDEPDFHQLTDDVDNTWRVLP